ncbi:glycosyltransferase family 4 protein [Erwinia rhapontici]|uniref:glycosyltransferase family 4 protein n=1 Tax=Erwinia rhapontici TaxID=55212 RepID=UPI0021699BD4|nr:glycosyltransferase family 4 protein [Erwinia rhapontici]MCS3607586.1 glycosyltransferase involved in cell wall biosynthesis [Erwinia rhapontici]
MKEVCGKRIAILVDDYLPHSNKVAAKMMHELACEFQSLGNSVTLFTPFEQKNKINISYLDDVKVVRFRTGRIKNCSFIKRGINESLLSYNACRLTKNVYKNEKYDLVVSYSPSIFWGSFAKRIKKINNCPVYLILRDFFPQWIIDSKLISEKSLIAKYFKFIERINYASADVIGIQSPGNIAYFKEKFPDIMKTELLYNWASPEVNDENSSFRQRYNLQGKIIFFYGGNLGKAQDMSNLLTLSKKMAVHPDAHFLFVGNGDEEHLIKDVVDSNLYTNITFCPPVSQEEFKRLLKEVDVGLFTLNKHHRSHNFPGKILGYMVNGIPILGSVNQGNDLKSVIHEFNAGFVTENGDDDLLYHNAELLLRDRAIREQCGENAVKLFNDKFTVAATATKILSILKNRN